MGDNHNIPLGDGTVDSLDPVNQDESRKIEIILIFENIFKELGYESPEISNIQRTLLHTDGSTSSINFFDGVHSEIITPEGKKVSHRGIIVTINDMDVLIVHEARSVKELPDIDTGKFDRIITGEDVLTSGKASIFAGFIQEIVHIETVMRKSKSKMRKGRDTSSLERVAQILAEDGKELIN